MGINIHIEACNFFMLFVLIFIADGFGADIPSYSRKEGTPSIFGCWPCSAKHILLHQYNKHSGMLDSDSQGLIVQKLPSLDSCNESVNIMNLVPQLSFIQQNLVGEGSHRTLHSSMKFDYPSDIGSVLSFYSCEAVVIERLPQGVFADTFELQHLVQRGVFVDAAVYGDTNLELPSTLSNSSAVEIHIDIENLISSKVEGFEITLELPLHARYPPLDGIGGYSIVHMDSPELLMNCRLGKEQEADCLWVSIAFEDEFNSTKAPSWQIPSGNSAHSGFVSAVTFASASVSAILIVMAARSYPTTAL